MGLLRALNVIFDKNTQQGTAWNLLEHLVAVVGPLKL